MKMKALATIMVEKGVVIKPNEVYDFTPDQVDYYEPRGFIQAVAELNEVAATPKPKKRGRKPKTQTVVSETVVEETPIEADE